MSCMALAPHCKKAVFDADALRLPLPVAAGETIYTPHAGEFFRITGIKLPDDTVGRADVAQERPGSRERSLSKGISISSRTGSRCGSTGPVTRR